MAEVVVIGAGLGGMAAAARLSKLGHRVTVCERNGVVGGCLRTIAAHDFSWDAGPSSTSLPAVLRDLFRKSGRPIERYLDLRLRTPARRHVFTDGSTVDLPTGSRAAQIDAVDAGLGAGSGSAWADFVDQLAEVWDIWRLQVLDHPAGTARLKDRAVRRGLGANASLARLVSKAFTDERLRTMVTHPIVLAGSIPSEVPAFAAVETYIERTFGVWDIDGGMAGLSDALVTRLRERGVDLRLDCEVTAITGRERRVTGVRTVSGGDVRADVVVCDIHCRRVFDALLEDRRVAARATKAFAGSQPAAPITITHVGLRGDGCSLPAEVVFHGDPLLVLQTQGRAPTGHRAWTLISRGETSEDTLTTLARRGVDVRGQVVCRVDRSAADLTAELGGAPYGVPWAGWRRYVERASFGNPLDGLYCLGASMHPGPSLPYVAWGAAHVAAAIGGAGRSS